MWTVMADLRSDDFNIPSDDGTKTEENKIGFFKQLFSVPEIWRKFYVTSTVCLSAFSAGTGFGWGSPMMLKLSSRESPVGFVSSTITSRIIMTMQLSSIFSMLICGILADQFGRKTGLWFLTVWAPSGWIMLATAYQITDIFIGAALVGTSSVGGLVTGMVYLSEIATEELHGPLITVLVFFHSFGMFISHLLGEVCSYEIFNFICSIFTFMLPILYYRLPESPQFLVLHGRIDEAMKALEWYHGKNPETLKEKLEKLTTKRGIWKYRDLTVITKNRRVIYIVVFFAIFSELCGTSVIEINAGVILVEATHQPIQSGIASLVLAAIRFFAGIVSCYLVQGTGRKVTLIASVLKMGVSLIILAFFMIHKTERISVQFYGPLICLLCYTLTNQIFLATTDVISCEIAHPSIKGVVMAVAGAMRALTAVVCTQVFLLFRMWEDFVVGCSTCIVALVFIVYYVPETRGKSLADIRDEMNREILPNRHDGVIPSREKQLRCCDA